jgi:hypothetical protein
MSRLHSKAGTARSKTRLWWGEQARSLPEPARQTDGGFVEGARVLKQFIGHLQAEIKKRQGIKFLPFFNGSY